MYTTEFITHGVLVDVYINGMPYTKRHEAVLAKAKPEWGTDPFTKRLTGAQTYGELKKKVHKNVHKKASSRLKKKVQKGRDSELN